MKTIKIPTLSGETICFRLSRETIIPENNKHMVIPLLEKKKGTSSQTLLSLTSYTALLDVNNSEPSPFHLWAAALDNRTQLFAQLRETVH